MSCLSTREWLLAQQWGAIALGQDIIICVPESTAPIYSFEHVVIRSESNENVIQLNVMMNDGRIVCCIVYCAESINKPNNLF